MATRIALGLILGLSLTGSPEFTEWSAPRAVGAPVNTTGVDGAPYLSQNGRSLYLAGAGPDGSSDVLVARRASVDRPWDVPLDIPVIKTAANETNPTLSPDERRLYFTRTGLNGLGNQDVWVSQRHDRRNDVGWESPLSLGSNINTTFNEISPTLFKDERTGVITMYFASDRAGLGSFDIYSSRMLRDGTFMPAVRVDELSSAFSDQGPHVRKDGLEIFLASNRPGTLGQTDLMVSTRASTSDRWSTPLFLGAPINTPFADQAPGLSFDGTTLYYASTGNLPGALGPCSGPLGPCVADIFVVTRSKRKGLHD